jgi:hypothetical protein
MENIEPTQNEPTQDDGEEVEITYEEYLIYSARIGVCVK